MLFAYRVTAGQESIVADMLHEKVKKVQANLQAIIVSPRLRGYLIVEAPNEIALHQAISNIPHVKGALTKSMKIEDIADLLETKIQEIALNKGDVIEITSGPFKGERAKVVRIDKEKDELTVELVEVAVPIPVTIKPGIVKMITAAAQ